MRAESIRLQNDEDGPNVNGAAETNGRCHEVDHAEIEHHTVKDRQR